MERLKDKVAIVSGAADGMGEAIVKLFAAEGAQVLGVDLNAEKLKEAHGGGTNSIKLLDIDVTDDDADEKIIGETLSAFGAADILVNCAGVVEYENTEIMRDDNWERTLDVISMRCSDFVDVLFLKCESGAAAESSILHLLMLMSWLPDSLLTRPLNSHCRSDKNHGC